ncbi:restriction endonuclease subunit S [Lactobacillus johnsonii]|uniref:restriction endonuclease subunit S n=1 Tax=Lactobacillus johnsonii TaxID=33959 RepID=UPI003DA64C28
MKKSRLTSPIVGNYIQRGRSPKYDKESLDHPIISQKCVQWNSINIEDAKHITEDFFKKLEPYRFIQKNDILWNSTGTGTVGRLNIVKDNYSHVPVDSHVTLMRMNQFIDSDYIYYFLRSPQIQKNLGDYLTGTTKQKELGLTNILKINIPLPPVSEQSRIAAKIVQLLALLRKVESSTQQYAKLQTLLKSKVLDLAMRGKLVEQDPNDEPASVLLEKIKAEKEQLIKEKKMKKSKPLPPIADDEKPFEIPDSWEWVRLGEVNTYIGKNIHPEKTPEQLFELYSVPIYETNSPEITSGKEIKSNKQTVIPDDILLCKINPRINRVWRVGNYTNYKNIASTEWIVVRQSQLLPDYLRYVLMSPYFRKLLQSNVSGVGGSLTRAKPVLVKKYVIPIPPLSEQSRISLKIAHLFTLLK